MESPIGTRIALISPNTSYRLALKTMLGLQSGMVVVISRSGVMEAIAAAPQAYPDVVVIDGKAGDSVSQARRVWPDATIICLLDYLADWEWLLALGAQDCVLKDQGFQGLLECIRKQKVHRNEAA